MATVNADGGFRAESETIPRGGAAVTTPHRMLKTAPIDSGFRADGGQASDHFTPCINLLMSGAIRNRTTPAPSNR